MSGYNTMDALRKLQENPKEFFRNVGLNVPDELMNNPQAIVMHLFQTGQFKMPAQNSNSAPWMPKGR